MKKLFLVILTFIVSNFITAQQNALGIRPEPQSLIIKGSTALPESFYLKGRNIVAENIAFFSQNFKNAKGGIKINLIKKKIAESKNPEAYSIQNTKRSINITSPTDRGLYYGLVTLKQIIENNAGKTTFPLFSITDYPDTAYRGVVEGFYGKPWSFDDRVRQLQFYGENKLNTYIYGPKDDPYHSSPNWRKPYPEAEGNQLKQLVNQAKAHHVDFVWAIHPGQDIQWNEEDRKNLINKFEAMYALGVRSFAVFFDDIYGDGTNPEKQAELLNFLDNEFVKKKKGVTPLIMCPTEYNKAWANPKTNYLTTLGKKLNPTIQIMWTGDSVIGDVSESSVNWIAERIQREPYFWWNFPVTDYVRNHLMMGRAYGLDKNAKNKVSAIVSNPMEHAEASIPAIYSLAQFTWNMKKYDSQGAWKEGIRLLMPHDYEALQVFANHNSDPGQNGHRFRREESQEFKPIADRFLSDLKNNQNSNSAEAVRNEFQNIVKSAETLIDSKDNLRLTSELSPWLLQFKNLGLEGLATMDLYNAYRAGNQAQFLKSHAIITDIEKTIFELSQPSGKDYNPTGAVSGTLVMKPLIEETFTNLTEKFNSKYGTKLPTYSRFTQHKIFTRLEKLKHQPLIAKDKSIEIAPVLETISIPAGGYFGLEFHDLQNFNTVILNLGTDFKTSNLKIEASSDANEWTALELNEGSNGDITAKSGGKKAKYVRAANATSQVQTIRLKMFKIQF